MIRGNTLNNNEEDYDVDYSEKETKARIIRPIPVIINISSVLWVILGIICNSEVLTYVLLIVAGVLPIAGFIISFFVRKKYYFFVKTYSFVFFINIVIYLVYVFVVYIIGFICRIFYGVV